MKRHDSIDHELLVHFTPTSKEDDVWTLGKDPRVACMTLLTPSLRPSLGINDAAEVIR